MKKKIIGIVVTINDYKKFFIQNSPILNELSLNFESILVVNLLKLKIGNKENEIINENCLPNNFICKNFNSTKEFLHFFKDKELIAIQYLSKTLEFFKIHYLLKKLDVKNIMIMNLGNFGNQQTIEWNFKYLFTAYKHYYVKGFYYIFRILTIINIFPKIDLLFESNIDTINAHNTGISRKFENLFPYLKISYFRKIEKINSFFFDHFTKNTKTLKKEINNKILYVDTPLNHPDRIQREGSVNDEIINKYYKNLNLFLVKLSKLFDMKVLVCLHPKNYSVRNYFNNFEISNKPTIDTIPSSEIIVFSLSSAVLAGVMYKKKILNIKSNFLGDYLGNISVKYVNSLNFLSHNIDDEFLLSKEDCLKKMRTSLKSYDTFISKRLNCDGNNISTKKIIEKIKENFF